MDTKRNCAERMRPILRAMERSIDAARQSRTGLTSTPEPAAAPEPTPQHKPLFGISPAPKDRGNEADQSPPRLKARPKPMNSTFAQSFQPSPYRAQAG